MALPSSTTIDNHIVSATYTTAIGFVSSTVSNTLLRYIVVGCRNAFLNS